MAQGVQAGRGAGAAERVQSAILSRKNLLVLTKLLKAKAFKAKGIFAASAGTSTTGTGSTTSSTSSKFYVTYLSSFRSGTHLSKNTIKLSTEIAENFKSDSPKTKDSLKELAKLILSDVFGGSDKDISTILSFKFKDEIIPGNGDYDDKIAWFVDKAIKFKTENIDIRDALLNQLQFRCEDAEARQKLSAWQRNDTYRKDQGLAKLGLNETKSEKVMKALIELGDKAANPSQELLQALSIYSIAELGVSGAGLASVAGIGEVAGKDMTPTQKAAALSEDTVQAYNFINYFVSQAHTDANVPFEKLFKFLAEKNLAGPQIQSYNAATEAVTEAVAEAAAEAATEASTEAATEAAAEAAAEATTEAATEAAAEAATEAAAEAATEAATALAEGVALISVAVTGFALHAAGAIKHMNAAVVALEKAKACVDRLADLELSPEKLLADIRSLERQLITPKSAPEDEDKIATFQKIQSSIQRLEDKFKNKSVIKHDSTSNKLFQQIKKDYQKIFAKELKQAGSAQNTPGKAPALNEKSIQSTAEQRKLLNTNAKRGGLKAQKKTLIREIRQEFKLKAKEKEKENDKAFFQAKESIKHYLSFQKTHQGWIKRFESAQAFCSVGAAAGAGLSFAYGGGVPIMIGFSAAKLILAAPQSIILGKARSLAIPQEKIANLNLTSDESLKNMLDTNNKLKRDYYKWHGFSINKSKIERKFNAQESKAILNLLQQHSKSARELKRETIVDLMVNMARLDKEAALGLVAQVSDKVALDLFDKIDDFYDGGLFGKGAFTAELESANETIMKDVLGDILRHKRGFRKIAYNMFPKYFLKTRANKLDNKLKFKTKGKVHIDQWTRFVPDNKKEEDPDELRTQMVMNLLDLTDRLEKI